MGVDYKTWTGALIMAAVQIGLLIVLALILRKKPSAPVLAMSAVVIFLVAPGSNTAGATAGKAIVLFLTYALFVGFGEEIIYGGYMQSRLNEAFGNPTVSLAWLLSGAASSRPCCSGSCMSVSCTGYWGTPPK
jgi:membrane protease YdiL (CAAX protease family)